jgi:G:T-mismatch repair DNA endonuclease (very short patch repair protein)
MREKILTLIQEKPKHYSAIIQRDLNLSKWVNENSLSESTHFPSKIYSAVYQVSLTCSSGNTKQLSRWNNGLSNCGPANVCKCTRDAISENVASSKRAVSKDEVARSNKKRSDFMLQKYGVEFNSQRADIKHIWQKPKIHNDAHNKLTDKAWLANEYCTKKRSCVDIAQELNVYYSTVTSYCIGHGFDIRQRSNYSIIEVEIQQFIESLGVRCDTGNRTVLKNKEIDLYLPDRKIGIEVDGLYWHSYNPSTLTNENRNRHVQKTIEAAEAGVLLLHISDWEWRNKQAIVKSMIISKLGRCNNKLYARKCTIEHISTSDAKKFFNENHLQGFVGSTYYLGLVHNKELVMMISAGRNRFSTTNAIELYRMASKINIQVVGGGSKLIKELQKITGLPIETYCDRSKSSATGYKAMGFALTKVCGPGYFWTNGNEIISRYKCRKSKLQGWLKTYDPLLSETNNMFLAGYRRFWDCGNYLLTLN